MIYGPTRHNFLIGSALILVPSMAMAGADRYDIQKQSLAHALRQFALESGSQVLFKERDAHGRFNMPLHGSFDDESALRTLLQGTGLRASKTPAGLFIVKISQNSSISRSDSSQASVIISDNEPRSPAALEDIVVTAQKRAENLQNVPIAITALSIDALRQQGVTDTASLGLTVPGLNYTRGSAYSLPRIRGVGTNAVGAGVENSVAVYIDNVYIASTPASLLSFNNISQISVLKGPQGTLFGRNATGGVIQITTLDPGDAAALDVSATAGNLSTVGASLYASTPVTDRLGANLAVYYWDRQDGFGKNLTTGNDAGTSEQISLRSKVKWEPASETTIRITGDYSRNTAAPNYSQAATGSLPFTGIAIQRGKFDTTTTNDQSLKNTQWGISSEVSQDIGSLTLVSISAYRRNKLHFTIDGDTQPEPAIEVEAQLDDRQFSQELQLTSLKNVPLTWTIGGYYFKYKSAYEPNSIFARTAPYVGSPTIINAFSTQISESFAGFGQATYRLTDRAHITGGLRYTTESRNINVRRTVRLPNGFVIPSQGTGERRFNKLTWRVAGDYSFSDEVMVYASFNTGFKSGLFDPVSLPVVVVNPETLDAYEAGIKAHLLNRRLRLNAAFFHYDYSNVQFVRFVNGAPQLLSGPSAKVDGVDIDVTAKIGSRLTVSTGLSVLDDRFTRFPNAVISTPIPTGGNAISTGSAKGKRLPMTPDWTANLAVNYTLPTKFGELEFSGNYFHNDGYFEGPENRFRQKAFDVVNGSVKWTATSNGLYGSIWAKNLFDEYYGVQLSVVQVVDGVYPAEGRTFGITIGYKL